MAKTSEIFSISEKHVLLTGAASGIGSHLSHQMAPLVKRLSLLDINAEALDVTKASILAKTPGAIVDVHVVDVTDADAVARVAAAVHGGQVDGMVCCAGLGEGKDSTPAYEKKVWEVNVGGCLNVARGVKVVDGGSVVLIGSMSGAIVNVPQKQIMYNISKAAVRHLASCLAVDYAGRGIRVNCISPGYIRTPLSEKVLEDDPSMREKWVGGTPLGRFGEVEDITGSVIFLLSGASGFITGADIRIDGGYTVV